MNSRILSNLIIITTIGVLVSNLTLLNEVLGQTTAIANPTNNSDESLKNTSKSDKNILGSLPLVINITKNSNATDTVIDFVIDEVNSSAVDSSMLQQIAQERIPLLIETLKNTNASSIVAEYVLNATKASVLENNLGD